MFAIKRLSFNFSPSFQNLRLIQVASIKFLKAPPSYDDLELPEDRRRLQIMHKVPKSIVGGDKKAYAGTNETKLVRGVESVHNKIEFGEYAIQALEGGEIKFSHFEILRLSINRGLDETKMFAKWRVDPPWRPKTSKVLGARLGGGKAAIKYYCTPVKAERIIVELGGVVNWPEAKKLLRKNAQKLPFRSRVVSKQMLEMEKKREEILREYNVNLFDFVECAKENYLGIQTELSPYDYQFKGPGKKFYLN